jgi:hypothetical protein
VAWEALRQWMESVAVAAGRPEEDDDSLWAGTGPKRSSGLEARWAASIGGTNEARTAWLG